MAGIGSALETGDDLIFGSKHVHDLAFTLVAPLQSENYIDFFHL